MEKLLDALKALLPPTTPEYCFLWINHWATCMSRSEWASWAQAIGAIAGIGAAIYVPIRMKANDRKQTRLGYFELIALDVKMAQSLARSYLRYDVVSPAYRVPLHGAATALPSLVADGCLNMTEASNLAAFYVDAESFNRCLDLTADLRRDGGNFKDEKSRNAKKAQLFVSKELRDEFKVPKSRPSRYELAMEVLSRHLPPEALERLALSATVQGDEEDTVPEKTSRKSVDSPGGPARA